MLLAWLSLGVLCSSSLALDFTLRHIHRTRPDTGGILWADLDDDAAVASATENSYSVGTKTLTIQKPVSLDKWKEWRSKRQRTASTLHNLNIQTIDWKSHETTGPATDKRETLLTLAKMTSNSYFVDDKAVGWYDLGGNWTNDHSIGYDPSTSGFRGHVFLSSDNKTAVLSIKGTSAIIVGGGPTVAKDKLNDNLLFSCCCARVDWTWSPVCGCFRGGGKCDQWCVEESLVEESLFYDIGINLYNNLTYMYPEAQIWVIGHSLGGGLASLIGATFGAPVVAFESPGEKLAAQRLHLPTPPELLHITHVYNTADPIPMVRFFYSWNHNEWANWIRIRGHVPAGRQFATKQGTLWKQGLLHWSSGVRAHLIDTVIQQILDEDWSTKLRKSRKSRFSWPRRGSGPQPEEEEEDKLIEVPAPTPEIDCAECFNWEYGDFPLEG